MDFTPTETQSLTSQAVTALLADRHDFESRRRRLASGATHDPTLWSELASLGLTGVEIAEAYGGSGGGFADLAAVLEPFGAALVNAPFIASTVMATDLLRIAGTDSQKAAELPRLASGERIATVAHTERRARDRLAWVEMQAVRQNDGWRLDGAKAVVMAGDAAGLFLVSARISGAADDETGLGLFLVPADAPHLGIRPYPLYDGSGAADLTLDGVVVADEARIGGDALPLIARAWDRAAAAVCVEAAGAMTALRDLTLDYIKTREQFGQPIGRFQALQHRMADLHMAVELARSMALLAVSAIDDPAPVSRSRRVSAAKNAISAACREVGQSAVQLHGGIALTEEYAAGRYFKRLTMIERLFGDADHHLRRYAALMD